MDALVRSLDSVLRENHQWVVPVYQRHYEWETKEDRQLPKFWDDLIDRTIEHLENRNPFPHYFGAIIFSEPPNQTFGTVRQRLLVDGQQRITTFQLTLAAIREVARDYEISRLLDATDAYLYNKESPGMIEPDRERFKLWPSSYDRSLYQKIVENTPDQLSSIFAEERYFRKNGKLICEQERYFYKNGKLIKGRAPNLLRAFWYLYEAMKAFVQERKEDEESPEQVLDALIAGFLEGFRVVLIQLDQNDDAQGNFRLA